MKQICFVTGTKNKLQEIQQLLFSFKIISLHDLNFFDDIPETENTIEAYRYYYGNEKRSFAKWDKLNNTPEWFLI